MAFSRTGCCISLIIAPDISDWPTLHLIVINVRTWLMIIMYVCTGTKPSLYEWSFSRRRFSKKTLNVSSHFTKWLDGQKLSLINDNNIPGFDEWRFSRRKFSKEDKNRILSLWKAIIASFEWWKLTCKHNLKQVSPCNISCSVNIHSWQ